MWLEHDLLKNPDIPGFFCATTSYRNEPNPKSERHLKIFPMFEFESKGTMDDLLNLLKELVAHLGFEPPFFEGDYKKVADQYGVELIESVEEKKLHKDYGEVFFLKNFPIYSHPFWNMKNEGQQAKKIDTILYGIETIGSAERSCSSEEMRKQFYEISDGQYADILFNLFGKKRVEKELEEFLSLDFFPRFGGGIGVTRLMRALTLQKESTYTVIK